MTRFNIDTVNKDLEECKELVDRLETSFKAGRLTARTAHAILVKVNDYLSLVEQELNEEN